MKTKKQISLLLAAVMLISIFAGIFATPSKPTFSDVPADHWAYEFVEKAAKEGWVAGVGNGRFGVDNQVTYAEFAHHAHPRLLQRRAGSLQRPDRPSGTPASSM